MNPSDRDLLAAARADHAGRNGLPTDADLAARERASAQIRQTLAGYLAADGIRASVLGSGWTERFDVLVHRRPPRDHLTAHGWVDLRALSRRRYGPPLWAVTERGAVLAGVRIHHGSLPDPVDATLQRCRERGEVRLLDVLELRELRRRGCAFPVASTVLTAAADIETGLGQRELVAWTSGRSRAAPVRLPSAGAERVVVAFSGVDGAGKSSLVSAVARDLTRASLPVTRVWLRPGMGLGRLGTLAGTAKRLLRQDPAPGVRLVAADTAAGQQLRSRRGVVGTAWRALVTGAFVLGVRRQHVAGRGVLLYDRHLLDALATTQVAYGARAPRLRRVLLRILLPRAAVTFYLRVPADVAVARKPGDTIGESAVRRQLAVYDRELSLVRYGYPLDGRSPTEALAAEVVRRLGELSGPARSADGAGHRRLPAGWR